MSLGLLEHLERLTSQESGECEGVELETIGQERRLHFKQNLTVQFNNRTSQVGTVWVSRSTRFGLPY